MMMLLNIIFTEKYKCPMKHPIADTLALLIFLQNIMHTDSDSATNSTSQFCSIHFHILM